MTIEPPVTSGKLGGYIVSERGIEADPAKVKAIVNMPNRNLKEFRSQADKPFFSKSASAPF